MEKEREEKIEKDDYDPLSPVRGITLGTVIGVIMWVVIIEFFLFLLFKEGGCCM